MRDRTFTQPVKLSAVELNVYAQSNSGEGCQAGNLFPFWIKFIKGSSIYIEKLKFGELTSSARKKEDSRIFHLNT